MRDGCLSSIISQLHKSENISVISILVLSAVASMLFVPVSAYVENVSFDGDSSFNLLNCSRIVWYIDPSTGHLSPPSLRSGPIQSGGASCVKKQIEGPAMINFWWKADLDIPQAGMLVFMVDDETILQCTSSDWSPVDYAVPSDSHRLSWEYRKLRSYPEYAGAGWIDDLKIAYPQEKPSVLNVLPQNETCCNQPPSIKRDIERMDGSLSRLETRFGEINLKIDNLSINQTTLQGLVQRLNLSGLDGRLNMLDTKVKDVNGKIANLSSNQTAPGNLSWISDNVVFISDNNANLTDIINKNKNKIVLLADGVYHTGGLYITADDVYLKSLHKGKAILDADNADDGILIDSVESIVDNITIDSVAISNCTNGIHIENSTNCIITNNLITEFKKIGIVGVNINNCTLIYNIIKPSENCGKNGIDLINSNNNYLLFNNIHFGIGCDNSYLYNLKNSMDNTIYVSNDGSILEDGVECGKRDSKMSECRRNNDIINYQPNSQNAWEFLH